MPITEPVPILITVRLDLPVRLVVGEVLRIGDQEFDAVASFSSQYLDIGQDGNLYKDGQLVATRGAELPKPNIIYKKPLEDQFNSRRLFGIKKG